MTRDLRQSKESTDDVSIESRTDDILFLKRIEKIEKILDGLNIPSIESALRKVSSVSIVEATFLSSKLDKLTVALQALAEKLDSEDVANLDTNYLAQVNSDLQ